ncbi:MAG: hypothetical protein SOZ01_03110 [Selenomonadaceae bacterium]|nr:hypothetical protein [Selenomonadaceae bacterium]MDY3915718.1 hypothetical protein [Selenomonadaceae bacterium]
MDIEIEVQISASWSSAEDLRVYMQNLFQAVTDAKRACPDIDQCTLRVKMIS